MIAIALIADLEQTLVSFLAESMEMQNTLRLIAILLFLVAARAVALSSSSPSFSPIVIRAEYEQNYNKTINATVEYVFLYPASNVSPDETNSFINIFLLLIID